MKAMKPFRPVSARACQMPADFASVVHAMVGDMEEDLPDLVASLLPQDGPVVDSEAVKAIS